MTDEDLLVLEKVHQKLSIKRPNEPGEIRAIAAECTMAVKGAPYEDVHFIDMGLTMAKSIFEPVYNETDEGGRWLMIDMCEAALRKEAGRLACQQMI